MRIVVYELNEIAWSTVDRQRRRSATGSFDRLASHGACFTTVAEDPAPLQPWVSWPTMHRGVPAQTHGIAMLGQDPTSHGAPAVWEIARAAGRSVGIFGCLASYPPAAREGEFTVPDPFGDDDRCEPAWLTPVQRLIRREFAASGRVVAPRVQLGAAIGDVPGLVRSGVSLKTLGAAARQLTAEKRDPRRRQSRASLSSRIGFDVFLTAWRQFHPDYGAFFTNHLAWLQHRYWRAAFPEDFDNDRGGDDPFYGSILFEGIDLAERQLQPLLDAADRDPNLMVVLASALGQAAVPPAPTRTTLRLTDPTPLLHVLGVASRFRRGRAMDPDARLHLDSARAANQLAIALPTVHDADGATLFEGLAAGSDIRIRLHQQHAALAYQTLRVGAGALRPIGDLGIVAEVAETPGTGHHIREGVLAFYGRSVRAEPARRAVSPLTYAPTLLRLLGVDPPANMIAPLRAELGLPE